MNKQLSRRDFIRVSMAGLGAAVLSTGLAGCASETETATQSAADPVVVSFNYGVASGDPLSDRVILWTHVSPADGNPVMVSWDVFEAQSGERVISGSKQVGADSGYTLKVDAAGLKPGTRYRYRFKANGTESPEGLTRTLPAGSVDSATLAVVSCSNYPAGYFHVYGEIATRTDLDAVLHLGDYIYEYGEGGYATERAAEMGRTFADGNNTEILSLADYRNRYKLYRSDPDLQRCHQNHPFIAVWDDHEVANDTYKDGAENHSADEGAFSDRKMAALQAYFEWLPIRPDVSADAELQRSFSFGDLLNLHMLDTRLQGRDRQLDMASFFDGSGNLDAAAFQTALADSGRSMLGADQRDWLIGQLSNSAATWQVLGQQVLMGRMLLPAAIATQQLSVGQFSLIATVAQIAGRVGAGDPRVSAAEQQLLSDNQALLTAENLALVQLPAIPYNLDAWDGYAVEREQLLSTVQSLGLNLLVLAGDTHNAWANNLTLSDGTVVAAEFATTSVSSPGLESYLSIADREAAKAIEAGLSELVPDLQYTNLYDRGYMTVSFSRSEAIARWHFVDTVHAADYQLIPDRSKSLKVLAGGDHAIKAVS